MMPAGLWSALSEDEPGLQGRLSQKVAGDGYPEADRWCFAPESNAGLLHFDPWSWRCLQFYTRRAIYRAGSRSDH
jgi:hypothetical protein